MPQHWLVFLFLSYCCVLARWGVSSDRKGWEVLAWFAFVNLSLNWLILDRMDSDWIHVIAAVVDFLTIRTLLVLSWNAFGKRQVLLLGGFWLSHLAVYVDINIGSSLIYDHYEQTILALLVCQMTLGANGILHICSQLARTVQTSTVGLHGFKLALHRWRDDKKGNKGSPR